MANDEKEWEVVTNDGRLVPVDAERLSVMDDGALWLVDGHGDELEPKAVFARGEWLSVLQIVTPEPQALGRGI